MERKTSPLVQNWKHDKFVTIELENATFPQALKVFSEKTGIKIQGDANENRISVTLRDVPFWKAVAELSAAAKTSFMAEPWFNARVGAEPRIEFNSGSAAFDHYQLIGPFHIGFAYRGTKDEPLVMLQASSLVTEGCRINKGIRRSI